MSQFLCIHTKFTNDIIWFSGIIGALNLSKSEIELLEVWVPWKSHHFIWKLKGVCTWSDFGHRRLKIFYLLAKGGRAKTPLGEGKPGVNKKIVSIPKHINFGTPLWRWIVILSTYTAFAQNSGQALPGFLVCSELLPLVCLDKLVYIKYSSFNAQCT